MSDLTLNVGGAPLTLNLGVTKEDLDAVVAAFAAYSETSSGGAAAAAASATAAAGSATGAADSASSAAGSASTATTAATQTTSDRTATTAAAATATTAAASALTYQTGAQAALAASPVQVTRLRPSFQYRFTVGVSGTKKVGATVRDVGGRLTWSIPQQDALRLPTGYTFAQQNRLRPSQPLIQLTADFKRLPIDPQTHALAVANSGAVSTLSTQVGATLDSAGLPKYGVFNRQTQSRAHIKVPMLAAIKKGVRSEVDLDTAGPVVFRDVLGGASYEDRPYGTSRYVEDFRADCGNAGCGTIRMFAGSGAASAEDQAITAGTATGYRIDVSAGWTVINPQDPTIVCSPSVFLSSGTSTAAGQTVKVTAQAGVSTQTLVQLFYVPHAGTSVTWQKNGTGATTTIDTSVDDATYGGVATLATTFAAGDYITFTSVGAGVELNGLYGENGQAGVVISKIAHSGTGLIHWSAVTATTNFQKQYRALKPDRFCSGAITGINDDGDFSPGAYPPLSQIQTWLTAVITNIRTAVPWTGEFGQDIFLRPAAQYVRAPGYVYPFSFPAMQAVFRDVAFLMGCAFRNMQDDYPFDAAGGTTLYTDAFDFVPDPMSPTGLGGSGGFHPTVPWAYALTFAEDYKAVRP